LKYLKRDQLRFNIDRRDQQMLFMIRIHSMIMIYFESNISKNKNMSIPYLLVFITDSSQVLIDEKVCACVS